jgi:hypothetical protein
VSQMLEPYPGHTTPARAYDLDAPLLDSQQTLRDLHMAMRGASVPPVTSETGFDGRKS